MIQPSIESKAWTYLSGTERENFQLMPPGEKQDPLLRQLEGEETFRVINLR